MAQFLERLALVLASDPLRQARHGAFRPRVERRAADPRGADGRRPRRSRGGRLGAGRAVRALRGREHVRALRCDVSGADEGADHARLLREAPRPDDDYPWAPTAENREQDAEDVERNWGHLRPEDVEYYAPSRIGDEQFVRNLEQYLRRGASPGRLRPSLRMNSYIDVRDVLPTIQVPTLVLHRTGDRDVDVEEGRYLAATDPGREVRRARRATTTAISAGERRRARRRDRGVPDRHAAGAGARPRAGHGALHRHRRLDERAVELGDRRWRELLEHARRGRAARARALSRPRGGHSRRRLPRHLRRPGARRPLRALDRRARPGARRRRSARASTPASASSTATKVARDRRAHRRAGRVRSPARAKCSSRRRSRIWSPARASSSTDRGVHELKGVPGEWRIYAAV